jgi:hypothetical protein
MLRAGLDLSRRKVDVCLVSSAGEIVDERASAGCRRAARPGGSRVDVGSTGARGDRVDARRPVLHDRQKEKDPSPATPRRAILKPVFADRSAMRIDQAFFVEVAVTTRGSGLG